MDWSCSVIFCVAYTEHWRLKIVNSTTNIYGKMRRRLNMDDSTMNSYGTGTGSAPTINTSTYCVHTCIHKLPCGYCTMLNRACPMDNNYGITWTTHPQVTCEVKA